MGAFCSFCVRDHSDDSNRQSLLNNIDRNAVDTKEEKIDVAKADIHTEPPAVLCDVEFNPTTMTTRTLDHFKYYNKSSFSMKDNGLTITKIDAFSFRTVYGSKVIPFDRKGIYEWKIKINNIIRGACIIGIDEANHKHQDTYFYLQSGTIHYGYHAGSGCKWDQKGKQSKYLNVYKSGDIVSMRLYVDGGSGWIGFGVNGSQITKAFDILKTNVGYCLAIWLCRAGDSITILSFDSSESETDSKSNHENVAQSKTEMDHFKHYIKSSFIIKDDGLTITKSDDDFRTVYGSQVISFDRKRFYEWKIKINKISGNCCIGIDEANHKHQDTFFHVSPDSIHYGYYPYNGNKCDAKLNVSKYINACGDGDIVCMRLCIDDNSGWIGFSVNGSQITKAFDIVKTNIGYCLAIYVPFQGDSISILSYDSFESEIDLKAHLY